jgi:hypothetical protein
VFEHGLRGNALLSGLFAYRRVPRSIVRCGSLPWVQCSSRCLDLGGWALLFAHARFSRFVLDAPSPRARLLPDPEPRDCFLARRRLSAPWMLTLRAPSFHIGAGRAFTENNPTSDALCRSTAPVVGSCPTASYCPTCHSRAREVRFTARARIVPPSPRWRSHLPSREDGGTTQGACHRADFPASLRSSARHFSLTDPTPCDA